MICPPSKCASSWVGNRRDSRAFANSVRHCTLNPAFITSNQSPKKNMRLGLLDVVRSIGAGLETVVTVEPSHVVRQ